MRLRYCAHLCKRMKVRQNVSYHTYSDAPSFIVYVVKMFLPYVVVGVYACAVRSCRQDKELFLVQHFVKLLGEELEI